MLETFSSTYGHRPSSLELAALTQPEPAASATAKRLGSAATKRLGSAGGGVASSIEMTPATRLYLMHQSLVEASSMVHAVLQGVVQVGRMRAR